MTRRMPEMRAADIGCDLNPISEYGFYLTIKPHLREALERSSAERGMREALALVDAARNATLPPGYQWGPDAMEQFNFGKERAASAVRKALRS